MGLDMERYEKLFLERQKLGKEGRSLIHRFLGKPVIVEASGYVVEGKLLRVDVSEHDGFGNIVLQTKEGVVLVRGSQIQSIGEVNKHGN